MKAQRQSKSGFTVVEAMMAFAVLIIGLVAALTGWQYVIRGERLNSVQNELDMDVRSTMERVRRDLRLSTLDYIFVWPQGVSTNTAISFPKARDDDGDGLIELDANGKIIWDITLVYHVWNSTPNELRLTQFDPRDNTLNDSQRQQQLEDVVTDGNGFSTYNSANASTRALFRNLFHWNIRGKGAQYDGYSPTLTRMTDLQFGSALLAAGNHDFKFTVAGKNASSTGYKIGLDTIIPSPAGLAREAEWQIPPSAQSGASAAENFRVAGSWSGNYDLLFPAGAIGNYFTLTLDNDRWEERNFDGQGVIMDDCSVVFDTSLTPMSFVVRPQPMTNAWQADWQTLDLTGANTAGDALKGSAVRLLIRGNDLPDGAALYFGGVIHCMWFYSSAATPLKIDEAWIAECTNHFDYCMDQDPATARQLFFNGSSAGALINANSYTRAWPLAQFMIDRNKSYLVTFFVTATGGQADSRYWTEMRTNNPPTSFIIPGTVMPVPTLGDVRAPIWSTNALVQPSSRIFSLEHIHILAASNSAFTSQIVDTRVAAPVYTRLDWTAIKPAGTDVKMKIRSGNMQDLSDAPAWTGLVAIASPGVIALPPKRYVQFQALMSSDNTGATVPSLRDVTVDWDGVMQLTDVAGTITMGPDFGIFELSVDNKPLVKGMTVELTIYEDIVGFGGKGSNRLTSTLTAEVEPRNTGK